MGSISKTYHIKSNDNSHACTPCIFLSTFHASVHFILSILGPLCTFTNEEPGAMENLSHLPSEAPLKGVKDEHSQQVLSPQDEPGIILRHLTSDSPNAGQVGTRVIPT